MPHTTTIITTSAALRMAIPSYWAIVIVFTRTSAFTARDIIEYLTLVSCPAPPYGVQMELNTETLTYPQP